MEQDESKQVHTDNPFASPEKQENLAPKRQQNTINSRAFIRFYLGVFTPGILIGIFVVAGELIDDSTISFRQSNHAIDFLAFLFTMSLLSGIPGFFYSLLMEGLIRKIKSSLGYYLSSMAIGLIIGFVIAGPILPSLAGLITAFILRRIPDLEAEESSQE